MGECVLFGGTSPPDRMCITRKIQLPPSVVSVSFRTDARAAVLDSLLYPFRVLGRYAILIGRAFRAIGNVRMYWKNLSKQMVRIGIDSIPIVALAAAFSGAVLTVQTAYQLETPFIPKSIIGSIVAPSIMLELGAVIAGFILAGRVGARIAAELGTMQVSEQIDALEVMGLDSISYLVLPRVLAGIIMFPVLYVVSCIVGIGTGIGVGHFGGFLSANEFLDGARQFFQLLDPFIGLIKSTTFGFIITSIACYQGYHTGGGAVGVGDSTTQATVLSCVFILVADLLVAMLIL
jgi:phospholipid/cholesterol/gamma-HCH transport system permease protein